MTFFSKKIITSIKILIIFFSSCLALPLLLIIYSISSLYLIRFQNLISTRFGHFAANTELYLCEKKMKINTPKQKYIDFFFCHEISNSQLLKMWKEKIIILPRWFLFPFFLLNNFFSKFFKQLKKHKIGFNTLEDFDVHNLYERVEPNLKFTNAEDILANQFLEKFGLPKNAKFVILNVRDSEYLKALYPYKDWSYHNVRNQDVDNYLLALEEVVKRGYYVFRVGGTPLSKKLTTSNPKIIDYTHSNLRNDFLDVYLPAKCDFCISTGSGVDSIVQIFRKPIVLIFMCPIQCRLFYNNKSILMLRPYVNINENRRLTINEILTPEISKLRTTEDFRSAGINVAENTQEEIRDIVIEMLDSLEGKKKEDFNDSILQNKFYEKLVKMIDEYNKKYRYKTDNFHMIPHPIYKAKIGANFLRNNFNKTNTFT